LKNSEYRLLRRRLVLFFMILTVLVLGLIGFTIGIINYYAELYSSQGLLSNTDFLLFYRNHALECNVFMFVFALMLLLILFLSIFFHNMNVILQTFQGEERRTPISFYIFPQFRKAQEKVKEMLSKRNASQMLAIEENEHKNELLMYLAHDLKTPLTSMIGYINHILDHKVDEEQQQNAIRIAYEKALRLDELIDEFSEILRYDDKVSQLNLSKIDINAMLHQQLTGFYPLIEKRNIQLDVDLPTDFYVIGDFDKLLRVFDNLMRNAINYSNEHSTIAIYGTQKKSSILLHYSNEAEQIDADSVAHLFDKFYRASTARTTTSGGAGLGLAIAKEIIELHHGHIHAAMEKQRIVFTIELPLTQEVFL